MRRTETRIRVRIHKIANKNNRVANLLKLRGRDVTFILNQPDHADGRRRINRACGTLIVERNINPSDGSAEPTATFSQSLDACDKLPEIFRIVWVAEVQIVG